MPYPYQPIRGDRLGMPPTLLGPTGKVFFHPRGISTHLNFVTGDIPGLEGKHALIPLLVPAQRDVGRLLAGERPTQQQYDIAIGHAAAQLRGGVMPPAFDTPDEALAYERVWHEQTSQEGAKYLPAHKLNP